MEPSIQQSTDRVERWGLVEVTMAAVVDGNPFDHRPIAEFALGRRRVRVEGFYDGGGTFRVRFMPDAVGTWTYELTGLPGLDETGSIECVPPAAGNHGPVRVRDAISFAYADGTPYRPYGTTCYAWLHQPESIQHRTLATLARSPFTKLRMCVFPKNYAFNEAEPDRFPFARDDAGDFDLEQPDPVFFQRLDRAIARLGELGIQCDLILFHPYDGGRWGFDRMPTDVDDRYLRYLVARLAAYRNIWWSVANEYDFMRAKTTADWDRAFATIEQYDPYRHLASIHNGTRMYEPDQLALYDHRKPWVSHVSLQHWDLQQMRQWRSEWGKPVVVDECGYEGDLPKRWGDLTAQTVVDDIWTGTVLGGHVGHGETYLGDVIWWSHGGDLHGESPARIAFLREIMNELPADADVLDRQFDAPTFGVEEVALLQYFGRHQPRYRLLELPDQRDYAIDVIDTWSMTRRILPGAHRGTTRIDLPGTPGIAVLARALET